MIIPRSEIVREFVLANPGVAKVFTVTEAADVAERLIDRAIEIDRDPNCEGTSAFGWSNEMTTHLYVIAKLARLLPGPRGAEVMLTPEESAVLKYALTYVEARNNFTGWERHG